MLKSIKNKFIMVVIIKVYKFNASNNKVFNVSLINKIYQNYALNK